MKRITYKESTTRKGNVTHKRTGKPKRLGVGGEMGRNARGPAWHY